MTMKRRFLKLLRQTQETNSLLCKVPLAAANNRLAMSALLSDATVPNDTICVNDTSWSMSWKDCKPSRLEASKMAVKKFISKRASLSATDRVAVVSFDSEAHIVLPFTDISNLASIRSAITNLETEGGTNIAKGLKAAARLFANDEMENFAARRLKRILLLTDGCGGNPIRISRALKDADILLQVIGCGSRSSVNEELLRRVATTDTKGFTHYWFVNNTKDLIEHYENMATGIVWKAKK